MRHKASAIFQPSCPSCRYIQLRLGRYLNPWSIVICQRCGNSSMAEEWIIGEDQQPVLGE